MSASGNDLSRVTTGAHACLIYDDPSEQLDAVLPFLRKGLEEGEQCIYVVDDLSLADVRRALPAYGVDFESSRRNGALQLWTRRTWRQRRAWDPVHESAQVRSLVKRARAYGFAGVRLAVEMTWTLNPGIPVQRLHRWEATLDKLARPDLPLRVICQYCRRRLSPSALHAGLTTHGLAIIDAQLYHNPNADRANVLADADLQARLPVRCSSTGC